MASYIPLILTLFVASELIVDVVSVMGRKGGHASHCNYLKTAGNQGLGGPGANIFFNENAAPFRIYTRSRAPRIRSGSPVEVTIAPYTQSLNFLNFTEFILYCVPAHAAHLEFELFPGAGPSSHLGVFQLFDRWRAGSTGMNCNPRSRSADSVGAFEERLLTFFRKLDPHNPFLKRYRLPARNEVSVLWWPTREALAFHEIRFEARIKSLGKWFKLTSTPWKVNRPVDQWAMTERMISHWQRMQQNMRQLERRLDQPV